MLHIILTILKIIGIVLLVLLGLLLLLVLTVLFVPIRYQVKGEKTADSYHIEAKVHWILHLLRVRAVYPEPGQIVAKILCFTLFDSKAEPKEKKQKKSKKKTKSTKQKVQETHKTREVQETKKTVTEKVETAEETQQTFSEEEARDEQKQSIFEKIKAAVKKFIDILQNIRYTIQRVCDKIKSIWTNIQYYVDVLKEEETKRAFEVCKEQLLAIWKNIRPKKFNANLKIGTGSPDSTGYVLAAHGMLYPIVGNNITVQADFEEKVFEGDFFIKGRITIFVLVRVACKIMLNKDVKHFLKRFKREA